MKNKWLWIIFKGGSGFLFAIVIFVVWAYIRWGSIAYGLVWLHGNELVIEPASVNLGDVVCKEQKKLSVRVKNLGSEPVRLIGANSSCACLVTDGVPATVPANGSCELNANLTIPSEAGQFTQDLIIYSELESQTFLNVQISGNAFAAKKNK